MGSGNRDVGIRITWEVGREMGRMITWEVHVCLNVKFRFVFVSTRVQGPSQRVQGSTEEAPRIH